MAKKSRYKAYLDGIIQVQEKSKRQKEVRATKSVLKKIKTLKGGK